MKIFANVISILFHPLLMITYGMVMTLLYTYLSIYPLNMKLVMIGGAFVCTGLVPGLFILLLKLSGSVSDLEVTDRSERVLPFLVMIFSVLVFIFFIRRMQVPFWFVGILIGVVLSLLLSLVVNFYWKISIHGVGIGGLIGAVMGIARIHMVNASWLFMLLILIAGSLATARIILNKHTPMQMYAGICLGFICTFVTSIVSYIYLLI
ncbi:MAG: hypothetical protein PHG27_07675 [Massilibacteroides sp.]|nr:hypothetical protein [Massilibacteroides sp.]MDD3062063.1 hypothetical protein [Massilibacteroides sp.]MDD4115457.1 hypothetical protein [Massilibacteroides sp.]MDD4659607.1 hypothetical protein [Massilibacteroides sp.]